ncbi:MAG TPA: hypothetical protein ENG34_01025, partial [Candidatus Aenigmarchaeota archaeon]|nr:hypothetical protein [Candidatus Aenigmarchaeota archaeon]
KKAKEVKMKHFRQALKKIGPSLNEKMIEFYKRFEERFKRRVTETPKKVEEELSYVG